MIQRPSGEQINGQTVPRVPTGVPVSYVPTPYGGTSTPETFTVVGPGSELVEYHPVPFSGVPGIPRSENTGIMPPHRITPTLPDSGWNTGIVPRSEGSADSWGAGTIPRSVEDSSIPWNAGIVPRSVEDSSGPFVIPTQFPAVKPFQKATAAKAAPAEDSKLPLIVGALVLLFLFSKR